MLIQEEYFERRDNKRYGLEDSGLYEPYTDNRKRLFLSLSREYGRCVSKVYVDNPDGSAKPIGWVFEKRMKYEDCNETYICETWVTLHSDKPTRTIEYHYL